MKDNLTHSAKYRRAESVLVLVYTMQSDVLLLRRVNPPDFWQSVTGALEESETAQSAATRELFEETGMHAGSQTSSQTRAQVKLTDHQCSSVFEINGAWRERYHPDQSHNREHLFSVQLEKQSKVILNSVEHAGYVWLPASQAMQQVSSATNRQAIEDIALTAQYRQS